MAELKRTSKPRVEGKEKSEKGRDKCTELQKSRTLEYGEKKKAFRQGKEGYSWAQHLDMSAVLMPFDKRF